MAKRFPGEIPYIPIAKVGDVDWKSLPRNTLTRSDIPKDYRFHAAQHGLTFDKDLGLKGKYCYHPFNTITVDGNGDIFMCICQAWLPISVGNILDFNSLEEIAHSPKAREIQASIMDGSYRYCDNNTCSLIKTGELSNRVNHRPDNINWINFAIDPSCNLTCPSCRKEFIFNNQGPKFDLQMKISDHMAHMISEHKHWLKFTLSGDGDPFASLVYRNLLSKIKAKKGDKIPRGTDNGLQVEIITNGILLKDHWKKLSGVYNNILRTKISFDAGTEETYNVVRRGGDWRKLMESAKFLVKWKQKNYSQMSVSANFVVQTENYKEMKTYVDICLELGFDEINFQKIVNWGTFGDDFSRHAVWMEDHPEHQEFLNLLKDPIFNNEKVILNNVAEFHTKANTN